MDDERAARIGRNENLFREVNQRIEELGERFGVHETGSFRIVCECGYASCAEPIDLPLVEYRAVRESPVRFFAVRGHEMPEVERVVIERDDYVVLEKLPGTPARVAKEGAPK
jgi:hypothetical protein